MAFTGRQFVVLQRFSSWIFDIGGKSSLLIRNMHVNFVDILPETSKQGILRYGMEFQPKKVKNHFG